MFTVLQELLNSRWARRGGSTSLQSSPTKLNDHFEWFETLRILKVLLDDHFRDHFIKFQNKLQKGERFKIIENQANLENFQRLLPLENEQILSILVFFENQLQSTFCAIILKFSWKTYFSKRAIILCG